MRKNILCVFHSDDNLKTVIFPEQNVGWRKTANQNACQVKSTHRFVYFAVRLVWTCKTFSNKR